ncbi:zinc finger protein Noc [Hylaeus anthracinus]|uniref:zinc finger protein Noc n=1 Tax=Hylaeus volcanicus TaxID=313075 RepID=UPI0023B7A5C0|nr:zinc finger protein Noc [Hylaeus volcanicus]XP_054008659.1 zinc finger protein Noc [Hylaeus anthracinus]
MVVLEEGGMLTTGHNQYLQPDYLSPLPTTLDAKKSPLALLAQTCSQIGADSPTKPLISPLDKSSKGMSAGTNAKSPPAAKLERNTRSSPSDGKSLAFKPYETNVVSKKSADESRPTSKASVHSVSGQDSVSASDSSHMEKKSSGNRTPVGRKSASPASQATSTSTPSADRKTPADREKTDGSPRNNNNGASPIIRSGMEILSGNHGKDSNLSAYKPGLAGFSSNPLCCPPGLSENPAFRPPFAGASPFSHHHAAAAALLGYPSTTPTSGNPYLSYARVKTPAGGEALVPVCKDPYCTGCQYSMHSAQLMMGSGTCPSGCTQCDHQKYGLAMALSSLGPMAPPSLSYPSTLTGGRPYVCNWIAGDSYCGKRFTTSEELLQHLRSHTSLTGSDHASSAALLSNPHPHPLLSPSAALHRASGGSYPTPSLSPLSARYHPYGKPPTGPLPASLAASPYSAFNALGPYYSPYAIYGQRIGAAVHP